MITFFRKIRIQLMKENKVSKYLLYAVSEILLVVIGIYIAIQFNNWNESKKHQKLVETNIGILIENLERDSASLSISIQDISSERSRYDNMTKRLNQPGANLDTLIKIARYEFGPKIHRVRFENDDAYDAMNQSGEINLMEKQLRQDIFGLYSQHVELLKFYEPKLRDYIERLLTFHSKYGLRATSTFKEGPIAEAKWEKATLNDLANALDPLMLAKTSLYNLGEPLVIQVYKQTLDLLGKLRKALDD